MPRLGRHSGKTSRKRILASEKARQAVELRLAGFSLEAIAKQLGYRNRSTVYRALDSLLAARAEEAKESIDQALVLELDRLDRMFLLVWNQLRSQATDSNLRLASIDRALKIQERRARYLGLDAAIKSEISIADVSKLSDEQLEQIAAGNLAAIDSICGAGAAPQK